MSSSKIPSLDGWRAVAVSLVFLSHAGLGHIVPGGLGVTIFFFLSGYLITRLLSIELSKSGHINLPLFYARRALRLTPPLLLTLVLVYTLTYFGFLAGSVSIGAFFAQLFYYWNYFYLYFDGSKFAPEGTGVFWSLAIEEHFYLVFPLALLLLRKNFSKAVAMGVLGGLCVLAILWRLYLVSLPDFNPDRIYHATDTRIDSIIYGCIFALLCDPADKLSDSERLTASEWLGVVGGGALIVFTLLYRDMVFRESARYSLQGVALFPLFYVSIRKHKSKLFGFFNADIVAKIGVYSYSIYLIHHVVLVNVKRFAPSDLVAGIVSAALAFLFAMFIEYSMESRLRMLRAKLH